MIGALSGLASPFSTSAFSCIAGPFFPLRFFRDAAEGPAVPGVDVGAGVGGGPRGVGGGERGIDSAAAETEGSRVALLSSGGTSAAWVGGCTLALALGDVGVAFWAKLAIFVMALPLAVSTGDLGVKSGRLTLVIGVIWFTSLSSLLSSWVISPPFSASCISSGE